MYSDGRGVLQDYKQAVYWYKKAAKQGNAKAQFNLGIRITTDLVSYRILNKQSIGIRNQQNKGTARAQYNLGVMYQNGQGVLQDYKTSNLLVLEISRTRTRRRTIQLGCVVLQWGRCHKGLCDSTYVVQYLGIFRKPRRIRNKRHSFQKV